MRAPRLECFAEFSCMWLVTSQWKTLIFMTRSHPYLTISLDSKRKRKAASPHFHFSSFIYAHFSSLLQYQRSWQLEWHISSPEENTLVDLMNNQQVNGLFIFKVNMILMCGIIPFRKEVWQSKLLLQVYCILKYRIIFQQNISMNNIIFNFIHWKWYTFIQKYIT